MAWPHAFDFPLADFVFAGGYVSIFRSVLALGVLLLWARLLTWADKDAVDAHLPRIPLNAANLGGLILAYGAFFWLPTFILPFLLILVVSGAEAGVYLQMRKKVVGLGDLKKQWEDYVKSWKTKKVKEGPERVTITGKDGNPILRPDMESPDRPAYDAIQLALADPLRKNADQIDIAPSSQGLACKYTVDGVSYDGPPLDPVAGAAALSTLKAAAGMDVNERRKPQTGSLKASAEERKKLELKLQSAGSTAGEYMRILVDPKKRHAMRLDELGLPPEARATILETVTGRTGIVIVAAPKGQGMTSVLYAALRAHDAFIEHIHSIERDPDQELEGITQNKLAGNASPAEESKQFDWVASQEPDVIALNKLESPNTAAMVVDYAASGKMAYIAIRAGSAVDAMNQWYKLAGAKAFDSLKLVICSRVTRKLCMACKEGYTPDPGTLRKLGLDPARVSTLYKARETALRDPKTNQPIPCDFCKDLRFKGRTGVFELVKIDDNMRSALSGDYAKAGVAGSLFKAAFRKQRGRYLQEEALAIVERGDTSVQEVLRTLRGESQQPAPAAAGAPPAAKPPAAARAPARPAR